MAGKTPKIEIEVKGGRAAAGQLLKLGVRARDVRPCVNKIERVFSRSMKRRFESKGRGSWPPLSSTTLDEKARQGQDSRVLRATGRLYDSIVNPTKVADPTEIRLGTDVPYAKYTYGTSHEPARKLIELSAADQREIDQILSDYIGKGKR